MSLLTLFQEDLLAVLARYETQDKVTEQRASEVEAFRQLINSADYAYDLWFAVSDKLKEVEGSPMAKIFPCFETSRLILGLRDILERPEYQPPFLLRVKYQKIAVNEGNAHIDEGSSVIKPGETRTSSLTLRALMDKVNYLNEALKGNSERLNKNSATIQVLQESKSRLKRLVSNLSQENEQLRQTVESQRLGQLDKHRPLEEMAAKLEKKDKKIYALQKQLESLGASAPLSRSLPVTSAVTPRLFASPNT